MCLFHFNSIKVFITENIYFDNLVNEITLLTNNLKLLNCWSHGLNIQNQVMKHLKEIINFPGVFFIL